MNTKPTPSPLTPARAFSGPEVEMRPVAIAEPIAAVQVTVNRFWLAVMVALLAVLGAVGAAVGVRGGLPGLVVAVALHSVPGLAIGLRARLRGLEMALSWFVGSMGVLILVSLPMALSHLWYPRAMTVVLLLVFAGVALSSVRGQRSNLEASWSEGTKRGLLGPGGLASAGFALAVGAAAAQPQAPAYYGAAVAAGPLWFVGLGAIVFAVCWAFSRGTGLGWSIVLLATVVPISQAVMYGTPTVQVAARHIGLVNQLIEQGGLNRGDGIYQAYSGLFASTGLVQQAAGWQDLMAYAALFGAVGAGVNCLVVAYLARFFVADERAWWAALVFALGSSLTTSFYAPQTVGFAFVTLAAALLLWNTSQPHWGRILAAVLLSIAVAPTHQLSPFLAVLVCAALVVVRLLKPWWTPVILLVPAVLWALWNRGVLTSYVSISELFNLVANLQAPARPYSSALQPDLFNRVTFLVPSAALVGIGVAALVALVRFHNKMTVGLMLAAASPVGLFAASAYGSEGIFRVALFALPWLAIVGSINLPTTGRRFWTAPWHPVRNSCVVVLTAVFVVGTTGMDYTRVINPADVRAIEWVETHVVDDSPVFSLGTHLAEPLLLERTDMLYLSREMVLVGKVEQIYPATTGAQYDPQADLAMLMEQWLAVPGTVRYVIAGERMRAFDERYGQQLAADQERLEQALRETPGVSVAYQDEGVTIYQLPGSTPS